jgi:hypothetical protein
MFPIGRTLMNIWPVKKTPLVRPATAVTGAGVDTSSTAEQTRFSEDQRAKAGLYGQDGKLEDFKPNLDEIR